jgi:hypothetical protein
MEVNTATNTSGANNIGAYSEAKSPISKPGETESDDQLFNKPEFLEKLAILERFGFTRDDP